MSTMTADHVTVVTAQPVGRISPDGTITLIDRAGNVVRSAFQWVKETARGLKFDAVVDGARSLGSWLASKAKWALGKVGYFGWGNLAGAAVTCGAGRDALHATFNTAYSAVKAPVCFALRPFAWLLRKVGLGIVPTKVSKWTLIAEFWLDAQVSRTMAWLDTQEHSWIMSILRRTFQLNIVLKLIRLVRPGFGGFWGMAALILFMPAFGARNGSEHATIAGSVASTATTFGKGVVDGITEIAEEAKEEVKADPEVQAAAAEAVARGAAAPVYFQGKPQPIIVRALKNSGEFKKDDLYSAHRALSDTGASWLHLPNGQQIPEADLDTTMWEIGNPVNDPKTLEAAARLAAAASADAGRKTTGRRNNR